MSEEKSVTLQEQLLEHVPKAIQTLMDLTTHDDEKIAEQASRALLKYWIIARVHLTDEQQKQFLDSH